MLFSHFVLTVEGIQTLSARLWGECVNHCATVHHNWYLLDRRIVVDEGQDVLKPVIRRLQLQLSGLVLLDQVMLYRRLLGLPHRDGQSANLT